MRSFRSETRAPVLLFERDGYQILTVFAGRWNAYTAWSLLYRDPLVGLQQVASGWTKKYEDAHPEAYKAFVEHKAWVTALHAPRG